VIELDRAEGDPIDLVVNGRRYATGRLVLVNGSEWAFQVEEILAGAAEAAAAA
jgi:flagellar motor switch protein FliN/FliY